MSSSAEDGGFGAEDIDEALEGASGTGEKPTEPLEYLRGYIKEAPQSIYLRSGDEDRYRVVSEGRSHRPAVWTGEEPEENQEVIDIERGESSNNQIS